MTGLNGDDGGDGSLLATAHDASGRPLERVTAEGESPVREVAWADVIIVRE
jgi:hypothetical protein